MKRRFQKLKDGQWSVRMRVRKHCGYVHKLKCCDCGLVHIMQYEVTGKGLRFRAWRQKKWPPAS